MRGDFGEWPVWSAVVMPWRPKAGAGVTPRDAIGIPCERKDFTPAEVCDADGSFASGTLGKQASMRMMYGHPLPSVMGSISSMPRETDLESVATWPDLENRELAKRNALTRTMQGTAAKRLGTQMDCPVAISW